MMRQYGLSDEDCSREISDAHVDEISRHYCEKWRSLYPHLHLNKIIVTDMERGHSTEEARRSGFILKWKAMKGSEATYRMLVCALLKIQERQDAEGVCKLLASTGDHNYKACQC